MRHGRGLIFGSVIFLILLSPSVVFSQEALVNAQEPQISQVQPPNEPEIQWVWGEVISIDGQKGELSVKYLDYETDQEKEIVISTDDKTAYENARSLSDIKPKDTLSIDYTINAEGKNIARNISLEQPETAAPAVGELKSVAPDNEVVTMPESEAAPGEQSEATPVQ